MDILSNIFGALGLITTIIVYQQKKGKQMLFWKMTTDIVWLVHFLCLMEKSVCATTAVAILRSIIFMNKEHAWARSRLWPAFFLVLTAVLSIIGWESWVTLLTMGGSMIIIAAYWIGNTKLTRIISVPVGIMYLLYFIFNGAEGTWWSIVNESFIILSSIVGIIRLDLKKTGSQTELSEKKA